MDTPRIAQLHPRREKWLQQIDSGPQRLHHLQTAQMRQLTPGDPQTRRRDPHFDLHVALGLVRNPHDLYFPSKVAEASTPEVRHEPSLQWLPSISFAMVASCIFDVPS